MPASSSATPTGFSAFGLSPALLQRVAEAGWQTPTPVQQAALPAILDDRDVLALAPTGSGKTGAFLLPLLHRLTGVPGVLAERPRRMRVLVVAPTRELAAQIAQAARDLAPGLAVVLAVGGLSINPQMLALRGGAHLVVGTPGRLLDLVDQRALQVSDLRALVLDEADRLLDLGFADEIVRLLAVLPAARQTLMFSATMPDAVAVLAGRVLHDAVRLEAAPLDTASSRPIAQRAFEVDTAQRTPLLRQLITSEAWERTLVFVATQYAAEHVADKLNRAGVQAAALHGQLSQGRRSQVLADFHGRRLRVLVATDLASRGIDVAQLDAVVNHDLPRSAVDHTHRIGRTGRAGAAGVAVSFICADAPGSEAHFRLIEKRQQQRVLRERWPGLEPKSPALAPLAADPTGGIKGRRKSKKDKLREAAIRR